MAKLKKFRERKIKLHGFSATLREAKLSDASALNEIINEPEVNEFLYVSPPLTLESTVKHLKEAAETGKQNILAEVKGVPVGSIQLRPRPGKAGEAIGFGISVSKRFWGTGVAQALVDAAFSHAKECGFRKVSAEVFAGNERGKAFYAKNGFSFTGIYHDEIRKPNGELGDELLMEKFL
jgi:RimJ/RimL family protein N-acetyltransferase